MISNNNFLPLSNATWINYLTLVSLKIKKIKNEKVFSNFSSLCLFVFT